MKPSAEGQLMPDFAVRVSVCYMLIPCCLALLTILRGSVFAPSLPFLERVWVFLPAALPGWIVAGVIIAGLIELTDARSLPGTVAATAVGAVLATTFNYYSLSGYYFLMRDRWPWVRPFYNGDVPLFKTSLGDFLIGPCAIYFYVTLAIIYGGYRALVPGARYLGDRGRLMVGTAPGSSRARVEELNISEQNTQDVPAFMRRLAPQLGSELILLSAEEHYIRIVTHLGSALVLHRFSDAIEELAKFDGDRVHRSFWIAWREVVMIQRLGRSFRLKMSSGEQVPVSRSQIGVVSRRLAQRNADIHLGHSSQPVAPIRMAVVTGEPVVFPLADR